MSFIIFNENSEKCLFLECEITLNVVCSFTIIGKSIREQKQGTFIT